MLPIWLGGLLLMPLLGGLVSAGAAHPTKRSRTHHLALVPVALAALCAIALATYGEHEVHIGSWLPGTGTMTLHTGGVGSYAAVATSVAAVVALIAGGTQRRGPTAIAMVALLGANLAFLAGHFLLRYLALEVVALCAAAAPLVTGGTRARTRRVVGAYVLLRIGDAGLLAAILLLAGATRTLDIAGAVAGAGALAGPRLTVATLGLLLAVWVKAGIWPLHSWQRAGDDLGPLAGTWLFRIVVPNLGLYLLYRVLPVIGLDVMTARIALVAAGGSLVAGPVARLRAGRDPVPAMGSLVSTAALVAGLAGAQTLVVTLLIASTLLHLLNVLSPGQTSGHGARESLASATAAGAQQRPGLATGTVLREPARLGPYWVAARRLWYEVRRAIAPGRAALAWACREPLAHYAVRAVLAASRALQRGHTGRVRASLALVAVALVLGILILGVVGW